MERRFLLKLRRIRHEVNVLALVIELLRECLTVVEGSVDSDTDFSYLSLGRYEERLLEIAPEKRGANVRHFIPVCILQNDAIA